MKQRDLDKLILNKEFVERKIKEFKEKGVLKKEAFDEIEIKGHLEKAEHNLKFVYDNLKLQYYDWCITGCYYAVYHAALSLILRKGYSSKNHQATLCILIKEFYKNGINKEDIKLINNFFLDYQDLLFYMQSKNKREDATYLSKYKFDKKIVEELRLKAMLFLDKVKGLLRRETIGHSL